MSAEPRNTRLEPRAPALGAPPGLDDIVAVELFCASGGMAEGFRRAGIVFSRAIDADQDACASYEQNLGQRPLQFRVEDLLTWTELVGAQPGRLDLVVADPPCTPWSRAGKRLGLQDPRDQLKTTTRLLDLWRPRTWLLGNLPGADDLPNVAALQATLGQLAAHYCIDYASLDAAAYGVPQHRVRPFWYGHPHGTRCLRWPEPPHGAGERQLQIAGTELRSYVTVREALQHLSPRVLGRRVRIRANSTRHGHPPSILDRPAMTIAAAQASNGSAVIVREVAPPSRRPRGQADAPLLVHRKHPINRPDAPSFTITTKGDGRGAQGACVMQWPWDRPSTVVTTRDQVAPCGRSGTQGEPPSRNAIKLSEVAAAILQGFPERWRFVGRTKCARWAQIGQAVPPALAEAVARSIAHWHRLERRERVP